jgi:hypothetical protein
MKRRRVKDEAPSEEDGDVSSDSGVPPREALPPGFAVDAAPAARLDSGVVAIEDVVPRRSAPASSMRREGTPPPIEDVVANGAGQSAEMLRLLRQPRYFDDDFEAVRVSVWRTQL